MHKCIGFAVSSVVVSCLVASDIISDPFSNIRFEPTSNIIFERVFEREDSEREVSERPHRVLVSNTMLYVAEGTY